MPSKPANLRVPYKIRFSIFFEKSKIVVNPMVWRCREFFFSKTFVFSKFPPTIFFSIFIFWGHFCILRNRMLCPEDRFWFIPVPVHASSGSNRFLVNRTRFPVPGLIPKFPACLCLCFGSMDKINNIDKHRKTLKIWNNCKNSKIGVGGRREATSQETSESNREPGTGFG